MTRKGYNTNQKYLIQSVKNTRKYVTHGRNPAVLIAVNKAGLHIFGSTEMEKVVRDHIDQFIAASKKDKKGLNDEDTEVVRQNLQLRVVEILFLLFTVIQTHLVCHTDLMQCQKKM